MKQLFSIAIVALFSLAQVVNAQAPVSGTEYYIENGCMPKQDNGIERTGLLVTDHSSADVPKIYVEAWNINGNKNKQIWTVADGYITNKASGKKIAFDASLAKFITNDGGDKFAFEGVSPNMMGNDNRYVFITREGAADRFSAENGGSGWGVFEQGGSPGAEGGNAALEGTPRAWRFIPVEEYENRPYPALSTSTDKWHRIVFTNAGGSVLAADAAGALTVAASADNDDNQLWKVIPVEGYDNKTQIINKATGKYLSNSGTTTSPALTLDATAPTIPNSIRCIRNDDMAIVWISGPDTKVQDGKIGLFYNGSSIAASQPYLGSGGILKFVATGGSGFNSVEADNISIRVEDRRLVVEGSDAPAEVYTLTGVRVDANKPLPLGINIARVAGKTVKLIVK